MTTGSRLADAALGLTRMIWRWAAAAFCAALLLGLGLLLWWLL